MGRTRKMLWACMESLQLQHIYVTTTTTTTSKVTVVTSKVTVVTTSHYEYATMTSMTLRQLDYSVTAQLRGLVTHCQYTEDEKRKHKS